jgi:hypothetical protein
LHLCGFAGGISIRSNHMTMEAAGNLDAITLNDRGVAALDVFELTDDFVFVDFSAFCECHVRLLSFVRQEYLFLISEALA